MRLWREVLNDRWMGGVLCVVLLLSFAFQVAGASRAAAAMIAPDPLSVLCSSSGDAAHRPAETDHSKPCPCEELCAAGLHLQAVPAPTDTSGLPIRFADRIAIAVDPSSVPAVDAPRRRYDVRGPPPSST